MTCPWCKHVHLYDDHCGVRVHKHFGVASAAYNCICPVAPAARADSEPGTDGRGVDDAPRRLARHHAVAMGRMMELMQGWGDGATT